MTDFMPTYDRWLIGLTLVLLFFGLLMVASASLVISDQQFGYPFHYLTRQAIYLAVGLVAAFVAMRIPVSFWKKISIPLLVMSLFLLLIVLIPGIGRAMNG